MLIIKKEYSITLFLSDGSLSPGRFLECGAVDTVRGGAGCTGVMTGGITGGTGGGGTSRGRGNTATPSTSSLFRKT